MVDGGGSMKFETVMIEHNELHDVVVEQDEREWLGLPCEQFIDWLNRRVRQRVSKSFESFAKRFAGGDAVDDAYQRVVLHLWSEGLNGDQWSTFDDLFAWVWGRMKTSLWYAMQNDARSTTYKHLGQRYFTLCVSQIEDEQVQRRIAELHAKPRHQRTDVKPDLGHAGPGWFAACMDDLTPLQREAFELTVVGDYLPAEAADMVGTTPQKIKDRRRVGEKRLRRSVHTGRVVIAEPVLVQERRFA